MIYSVTCKWTTRYRMIAITLYPLLKHLLDANTCMQGYPMEQSCHLKRSSTACLLLWMLHGIVHHAYIVLAFMRYIPLQLLRRLLAALGARGASTY